MKITIIAKLIAQMLEPLQRRIGLYAAGWLTAQGVPESTTAQVITAAALIASVAWDIGLSKIKKQRTINETLKGLY